VKLTDVTNRYIVVPVGGFDLQDYADRADLRVDDTELDTGVHALWADDDETIIAFAFQRGAFDEQQATAWAEAVEGQGVNMAQRLFGSLLSLLGRFGVFRQREPTHASLDNESFRQIEQRLRRAIELYFGYLPESNAPYPWLENVFKDYCTVEYNGDIWKFPYSFDENDELVLGAPQKVNIEYVAAAIVAEKYRVASARNFPLAEEERPWGWTTTKENAILDAGGWTLFGQAHLVVELEDGKAPENKARYHLPVAELIDGKLTYVWAGVRAARGALAGARGGVDLPSEVKTAILDGPLAAIYKKFGKDDLLSSQMFVFSLALGSERVPNGLDAGEGLVWKEVLRVGTTFRPVDGDPVTVDQAMIDALVASFEAGALDNVAVTAEDHFYESGGIVPADKTVGFVRRLKKVGDRLWAGLEVAVDEIRERLGSLIKDVSIFAWPDFHDRRDGKSWSWVLVHLLLTNYPQLVGLAPFGEEPVAASLDWPMGAVRHYREVNTMPDGNQVQVVMTQRDAEVLQAWQGLGLTVEQVQQMQKAHQVTLQKARALEIASIVAALEGRSAHEAVVALDGARHYPVVIKAVEAALKNGGEGLALDVSAEGRSPLDAVVLSIVNALPLEARMTVQSPPVAPATPPPAAEDGPPSSEAIDALDARIG